MGIMPDAAAFEAGDVGVFQRRPSALLVHLSEVVTLLTEVVHGPSWALRRAAAYCVLDLYKKLPAGSLERHPKESVQIGQLCVMLRDRKWRDKEGKVLEEITKRADEIAPKGAGKAEEEEEEEEAASGDM